MKLAEKSICCGCGACVDICPKKAIFMGEERGFCYPEIDPSKCVNCGLCERVCPVAKSVVNEDYYDSDPVAYAAWNTEETTLLGSTSGGIFGAMAKVYLENGDYVCGCVFSNDFKSCHHIVTNKLEDLDAMIRSKYFQSDMTDVYSQIAALLRDGKKVMFCGTPCQAAALYNYCDQKYKSNLLIVDLFCKGVPSQKIHQKFIELLEKKAGSRIVDFHPKHKIKGWGKIYTKVTYANGKVNYIHSPLDPLFVMQGLDVRPSCAKCNYKGLTRVSDISIGDFWGVKGISAAQEKKGVSAVIANTAQGEEALAQLGDKIVKEKSTIFEVSNKKNAGYSQKIALGKEYEAFYDDLERKPFEKVLKQYAINNSKAAIVLRKLFWAWTKLRNIDLLKFIYINFLCSHVQRGKHAYIIPGPNTIFEFAKGSRLIVEGGKTLINFRKPHGAKAEAWIQLNEGATLMIHKGMDIRNCRFVVQKDALFEIGKLEMNGLCNIVVRKNIKIGNDVMIARDVTIYDSDYHPFSIGDNVQEVVSRPVTIQDHVWIGNGATITKGVTIGEGAVVSTKSVVIKSVKPRTMVSGNPAKEVCKDVYWAQ